MKLRVRIETEPGFVVEKLPIELIEMAKEGVSPRRMFYALIRRYVECLVLEAPIKLRVGFFKVRKTIRVKISKQRLLDALTIETLELTGREGKSHTT